MKLKIFEGKVPFGIFWDYTECPYKAYLTILRHIRIETQAQKIGISFHEFAQKYHEDNKKPPDTEFREQSRQDFHEFEKQRWEYCKKKKIPWSPKMIEEQIEDDFFTSKIDRLDDNGDGTYTLVEYKKKEYKKKDIPQMSFSTLLLAKKGVEVSEWAIYYTEGPMYYKKPSKNSLNSTKRKMSLVKVSIKAGYFPARPGWQCKNCVYVDEGCDFQGIKMLLCPNCGEEHNQNVKKVVDEQNE